MLSDFFARVTVYERDELPTLPANRAKVPQDRHLHLLMARGAIEFESPFPGLLKDMVTAGAPMLENRPDCIYLGAAGHVLGTGHTLRKEFTAYAPSRPHLEWQLRRRILETDNVRIVRRAVSEPRWAHRSAALRHLVRRTPIPLGVGYIEGMDACENRSNSLGEQSGGLLAMSTTGTFA